MKMTRETLAVLEIPRVHAKVLLGHGPPDEGWIKVDTDASISFDAMKGGAGGVVLSSSGFIGAWSKPLPGVTDPLIAKAMSLREGVVFAKLRDFSPVVFEVDCFEVVHLWNLRAVSRSVVAQFFWTLKG
jgi:hypothetical protein